MTDPSRAQRISARRFHDQPGVEAWRVLFWGAYAHFDCTSLPHAARLVDGVARIAAELGHDPDLDVRPHGVTLRTSSEPNGALGPLDVALARRVQALAAELGCPRLTRRRRSASPSPFRRTAATRRLRAPCAGVSG